MLEPGRSVLGLVGSGRVDSLACWDFAVRVGAPSGSCWSVTVRSVFKSCVFAGRVVLRACLSSECVMFCCEMFSLLTQPRFSFNVIVFTPQLFESSQNTRLPEEKRKKNGRVNGGT